MKKVSKCRFFILCVFILISGSLIVASLLIERNNSENNRAISQVLVKISNTDTEAEKIINEKMHNNEILSYAKIEGENIYSLELKTDELNNLRKDNNIERVEDDTSIHILNTINNKEDFYSNPTVEKDSQLSGSTKYNAEGATISWNIQRIKADQLHKDNIKGYGIKVAVFDTGIDLNNDDINVSGGISFIEGITSYDDDNGHGTAMAGILAAQLNGYGLVGVAPDVELYSVKVLDRNGIGKYSNIIQGINWAIDHDIDIITLSLGGSQYSQLLYDAIEKASENNILIVAAAGNDGNENILYPAAYPQVICVGASDYNDNLAEFSNYGERLDIAAPGVDVVTTGIHNTMITLNGTSSAAQHVAGAAALLWSVNKDLSYITIKDLLCRNSSPLEKYVSDNFHYGLVNIEASYYKLIKSDYIDVIPDINILNQAEKYTNTGDNGDVHALACTHSWNKTSSTAAKCTSAGSQSYICKLCGATKTESIAALGHIMGTVNTATCTSAGNIIVKCTRSGCSYVQGTQPSSALGHNIYTTTSSTHVSGSGHLVTKTCSRCGKVTGSYYSDCATLENDSTHTNGKGHYWRIYDTICGITYSSGYTYNMTYFKDPSHVNGLGHYWTRYCAICGGESTSGYDNSTYISCDTSSNGHTSSGHLQNVYCSTCNTVLYSNYISSYTTTTGSHTAYGHYVQKKCDYCGIIANSYYTTISTCLSCTTAPSVSFN
ncbi:MAG TPA: S8 family peptidase, partial [Mobilitalea sp.]|nr:S8 family peptidase [Mobilitalea sp.]